jgi:hypothetical protein
MTTNEERKSVGDSSGRNGVSNTWVIVIMAVTVLLTLSQFFWSLASPRDDIKQIRGDMEVNINRVQTNLTTEISKNEKEIETINRTLDDMRSLGRNALESLRKETISVREHDEFAKREDTRFEENQKRNDTQFAEIILQVHKLEDGIVSRPEHIQHWNETDERFRAVTTALNELRKDTLGTYTVGDQLKQMQHEIDEIHASMTGTTVHLNSSPPNDNHH